MKNIKNLLKNLWKKYLYEKMGRHFSTNFYEIHKNEIRQFFFSIMIELYLER
jgi:hypothetical protein